MSTQNAINSTLPVRNADNELYRAPGCGKEADEGPEGGGRREGKESARARDEQ